MDQVELLRHVADNLEAGRTAGYGLLYKGKTSAAIFVEGVAFCSPELYSLAPRTRIINGIEVPAPMDNPPKGGLLYWMEFPVIEELVMKYWWDGDAIDKLRLSRGLCYDSPEAAEANCRARYGIVE